MGIFMTISHTFYFTNWDILLSEILQLVQVKCKQIKSRYLYAVFVIKGVAIVYNEQSLMHSAGVTAGPRPPTAGQWYHPGVTAGPPTAGQ